MNNTPTTTPDPFLNPENMEAEELINGIRK